MPFRRRAGLLVLLIYLVACLGDESSGPRPVPSALEIAAGGVQSGTVGVPLDTALAVRVLNQHGDPMAGVLVQFVLADTAGTLSHLTRTTGPDGQAATWWTLPRIVGAYTAIARVAELDSVRFSATAGAAAAATVERLGVDSQAATIGTSLDSVIGVRVRDGFGNPVAGLSIDVTLTGDGSVGSQPVLSDSAGEARLTWNVGSQRGPVTATLLPAGLDTVRFTAWALLPPQLGVSIAAGRNHGCRLEQDGVVLCWGQNVDGAVGDGSTMPQPVAVPIATGTRFVRVMAGFDDSCALTAAGVAWCWGLSFGPTPSALVAQPGPFVDLVVGATHHCALTADGRAWCAGDNTSGQLGDGTTQPRPNAWIPVATPARFRQLSAGPTYTCGISRAADVWCWGAHTYTSALPGRPAPAERFTAVATGATDTCALAAAGATWCWGNTWGPPEVIPAGGPVLERLWGGERGITWVYCGLAADQSAWCFGYPLNGSLGDGRLSGYPELSPIPVSGGYAFTELAMGERHSCGRTTGGAVACWGDNGSLALGIGQTAWAAVPVAVGGALAFTAITAEDTHACGLTPARAAWCWGEGYWGALGTGDFEPRWEPAPVVGGVTFTTLETSWNRTCGLDSSGAAWCWGDNGIGELGDGTTTSRTAPTPVAGNHQFTQLSTRGIRHGCGLKADHTLWCWGANWFGSLGDSTTAGRPVPTQVKSNIAFSQVVTGNSQTCALDLGGVPYCWGWPEATGQGSYYGPLVPSPVVGNHVFTSLHAGTVTMCGLEGAGEVWCWGRAGSWFGNADSTRDTVFTPVRVAAPMTFSTLLIGNENMCGLSGGIAYCWGENVGQVGDGTRLSRTTPVPVLGGQSFVSLSTSGKLTCGLDPVSAAWCWGDNRLGGLGNGTAAIVPRPELQP